VTAASHLDDGMEPEPGLAARRQRAWPRAVQAAGMGGAIQLSLALASSRKTRATDLEIEKLPEVHWERAFDDLAFAN
jgi:hypothetical protein